jgi:protein SCO1
MATVRSGFGAGSIVTVFVAAALAVLLFGSRAALGQQDLQDLPPQLRTVGYDQRLGEQVPLDTQFVDEHGKTVKLRDYFHRKPVILVMAYYKCPMLCTLVLNGLVQGMIDMSLSAGKDYEVITVSFDPQETPDLAAAKKETYVSRYGRPGGRDGWHFLTGQQPAIDRLAKAIGFRYHFDSESGQYAHAAGITVLTPEGKLSRYLLDLKFSGRDLALALVESSEGRISSPVYQALLFCFHYDPTIGRYGVAVMNFVRLGGLLTLVGVCTFIITQLRRERRMRAMAAPAAKSTADELSAH